MNARAKETLGVWIMAAIFCLILAFVANDAYSATLDVKAAQTAYDRYDDACTKGSQKACNDPEWRSLGADLSAAGWLVYPDHTWIRAADLDKADAYLRTVDNGARIDLAGTYNSRFAVLSNFRRVLPGNALAVWWRVNRQTAREMYPAAWAVLVDVFDNAVWQYEHTPHYTVSY